MKHVWENPEIQSLNRLPMRSPLLPFLSMNAAAAECALGPELCAKSKSPYFKSLDGAWKFALLDSPLDDEAMDGGPRNELCDWFLPSRSVSRWSDIQVPGTWTLQGFDKPQYLNVQMPFDTLPPAVPDKNPTGLYRLDTTVPSAWKGRRVVLHIGSAESCAIVFVNGKKAGVSKDTRLPCEFDITPFLKWRGDTCELTIGIKVVRYSDASFVEDQDQWWFGGIHRSVYLYSTAHRFMQDVEALAHVEDAASQKSEHAAVKKSNETSKKSSGAEKSAGGVLAKKWRGIIPLVVKLGFVDYDKKPEQAESAAMACAIQYEVYELLGNPQTARLGNRVARGERCGSFNYRDGLSEIRADIKINNVNLWSSESPSLYVLAVALCELRADGKAGKAIESAACTVGFKDVKINNRELLINGKAVYIRGVNRHEHNEFRGKTLATDEMLRDIRSMKAHNFNAVRACHYPDDERWYELCDRYGIYVLDEANIENHAYYDNITRDDAWTNAYMERMQRMVRRDKNHVSIFGWSLGNESGCGPNHAAIAAWVRSVDKTRVVHYEGISREMRAMQESYRFHPPYTKEQLASLSRDKSVTDIITLMYPPIDLIAAYAEKCSDTRPLIMCEYAHSMGNATGSLADYWNAIENHHGLQGGFIWDWIDQGIAAYDDGAKQSDKINNEKAQKYWKYGGDFGDVPSDWDFCLNGINFPDGTPKPAMEECRHLFAPIRLREAAGRGDKKSFAERGVFEIESRFDFVAVSNILLKWELRKNGAAIERGSLRVPRILPGSCERVTISAVPRALTACTRGGALVLHAEFVYARSTPFAKAGALIRADEFVLAKGAGWQDFTNFAFTNGRKAAAQNIHARQSVGQSSEAKRAAMTGEPISPLALDAAASFKPTLFRALIENECVKAFLPQLNDEPTPWSFLDKPTREWLNAGIDRLSIVKKSDSVFTLASPDDARNKKVFGTFECKTKPCRAPDGRAAIQIDAVFRLTRALSEYPRVGITAAISAKLTKVRWYGRGPHECYADRKASAMLGMYEMNVADMGVPYIVPQENGTRCDVTYLEFSGGGKTLHIESAAPFSFSVSKYAAEDLFSCRHVNELTDLTVDEKNPHFILTIDAAHRGVGVGACGPDTLEQYRARPGEYRLCLRLW